MNSDTTKFIWFNGKMVPWADAKVHVTAHALHYGSAVFEGIRAYATKNGPQIFRLKDHIDRLFNSAKFTVSQSLRPKKKLWMLVRKLSQRTVLSMATFVL